MRMRRRGWTTIIFQIAGSGTHTLSLTSALPAITESVVIDGRTQAGYTNRPVIELDGASAGANAGLRLLAGSSTVVGLAINRFSAQGLLLQGSEHECDSGELHWGEPGGDVGAGEHVAGDID